MPRGAVAAEQSIAATRPRREAAQRQAAPSGRTKQAVDSSESEEEEQARRPSARGAVRATRAPAPARGAAAPTRGRGGRGGRGQRAPPPEQEDSDSSEAESEQEDEDEEEEDLPARRTAGRAGTSKAAAGTLTAGTLSPDPSKRRSAAAAAASRPRRGRAAEQHQPPQDGSGSEEDEEAEDEEQEEGADDEGQAAAAVGRALAARGKGRAGGSGRGGAAPSADSRKRLLDLLERRVGRSEQHGGGEGEGGSRLSYGDLPLKNHNKKTKLMHDLRGQFDDWHSRLRSGFSVLLYGFGSKRPLLEDFAKQLAGPRNRGDAAVLVFNGYNPRCTAKEVVAAVAGALMQRTFRNLGAGAGAAAARGAEAGGGAAAGPGGQSGSSCALRRLVEDVRAEPCERHAFVVVHNLEGPGLRGDIPLLASLASCPQVHLIASMDHALAPLLWEPADAARFRWQYINATTFQPYTAEIHGAPSVLLGAFKSGMVTAGAGTVLRSLVLGAQAVFRVLAEYLREEPDSEGVAFAHLYRMCRERFLVRDERVLRQHLVEFVDHQLVRLRPASDNSGELLTIPMEREDLLAVLEELGSVATQ